MNLACDGARRCTIVDVDGRIGNELRQERRSRGIELEKVEAATGVRARFLRAIEDEEWELLPGEFYARAFTRTYAGYLGLDPAEFALEPRPDPVGEDDGPRVEPRLVPDSPSARQPRRWLPVGASVAALLLVAVVVAALVASVGDDGSTRHSPGSTPGQGAGAPRHEPKPPPPPATSLRLVATAEVWVCLLNGKGQPLIDGQVLLPGAEEGPFRSRSYSMAFGNGGVELTVDGAAVTTSESSGPAGYAIAAGGKLSAIPEGERPECA